MGGYGWSLFCCAILIFKFAIISLGKKESFLFNFNCLLKMTFCVVPHGAVGWSTVFDRGVSKSHSLTFSCDLLSSIATVTTIRRALL